MKHTQGKWKRTGINANGDILIGKNDSSFPIAKIPFVNNESVRQNADAKLIEAAPDMLEALRDIWKANSEIDDIDRLKTVINEIAASAIKKAND